MENREFGDSGANLGSLPLSDAVGKLCRVRFIKSLNISIPVLFHRAREDAPLGRTESLNCAVPTFPSAVKCVSADPASRDGAEANNY